MQLYITIHARSSKAPARVEVYNVRTLYMRVETHGRARASKDSAAMSLLAPVRHPHGFAHPYMYT